MKSSIRQLRGHSLAALDGEIGHVKDFYFEDQKWTIRYVIVDTGEWLPGRQVLLSPHAFGRLAATDKSMSVKLTRKQIEDSPLIATHKPVSRQQEEAFYNYYGWPYYWMGDGLWGAAGFPVVDSSKDPAGRKQTDPALKPGSAKAAKDAHLWSAQAVSGYHLTATNGTNGHVVDFIVDNRTWAITDFVVKTGHRLSGREVSVATGKVDRISFDESTVFANMTVDEVEQCPPHHPASLQLQEAKQT